MVRMAGRNSFYIHISSREAGALTLSNWESPIDWQVYRAAHGRSHAQKPWDSGKREGVLKHEFTGRYAN